MKYTEQIEKSLEIRRHNGQCAYGQWLTVDEVSSRDVVDAIVDEIVECTCRDNRREPGNGNNESKGRVVVGGEIFLYRR